MDLYSDRSWMKRRKSGIQIGASPEFREGVRVFLDFAYSHPECVIGENKIRCPCLKCKNVNYLGKDMVNYHLLVSGFMNNYIECWGAHGQSRDRGTAQIHNPDTSIYRMTEMVNDIARAPSSKEESCQALQNQDLRTGRCSKGQYFSSMMMLKFVITLIVVTVISITIRIIYVLYRSSKPLKNCNQQPMSTLIVLGSGGHTAEMINVISVLQKEHFQPRTYIAASTDNMSLQKARVLETSLLDHTKDDKVTKAAKFMQIYRSREVGQSYISSVGTTLIAIAHALLLMIQIRPQVILCNGPGTCIPLCIIAFFFKVFWIRWSSIFYVESIARVRRLSLSGLLLYQLRIADQFFVQWPQLQRKYPRAHYVGCLM